MVKVESLTIVTLDGCSCCCCCFCFCCSIGKAASIGLIMTTTMVVVEPSAFEKVILIAPEDAPAYEMKVSDVEDVC